MEKGVCSQCQRSGLELTVEDGHTVLDYHLAYTIPCSGSYKAPETTYTVAAVKQETTTTQIINVAELVSWAKDPFPEI